MLIEESDNPIFHEQKLTNLELANRRVLSRRVSAGPTWQVGGRQGKPSMAAGTASSGGKRKRGECLALASDSPRFVADSSLHALFLLHSSPFT